MPFARVHWQLCKQDIEMFTQYHELLMDAMSRARRRPRDMASSTPT
jgi:hypothetical protein